MTAWEDLYVRHGGVRTASRDLIIAVRRRLIALAERGHCAPTIQGRFTSRHQGALQECFIQSMDPNDEREPLKRVPSLQDARLTVLALLSRRTDHVHQFTAAIEGTTALGRPWIAAIHLEDDRTPGKQDRKGTGACGHAALHCHVGPTLDDEPKVRVPFPAVDLPDALDWLLSTVIPEWEPAPWLDVVARRPA